MYYYFAEIVAAMVKHLVIHLNIFSVIISDVIKLFDIVNIRDITDQDVVVVGQC